MLEMKRTTIPSIMSYPPLFVASLSTIGGDMNAQIGKNENNKLSLHNMSNRNGEFLYDFSLENRFNTTFQKKKVKL